jgi:integrase
MIAGWLNWMERRGYEVPDLPPALRARRKVPSYVTTDELARICKRHLKTARKNAERSSDPNAPTTEWMVDAWQFAFWQGLRRSEIVAQRVGGIDLERGMMRVGDETFVPKGQDEAVIPLAKPALLIAEKWMDGADRSDRLFRHASSQYLARAFTAAARKEVPEKPGISLHSLRHGRGVDLAEKGKPIQEIQYFLRHRSIDSTMLYVQVANEHLKRSIQSVEDRAVDVDGATLAMDKDR